VPDGINRHGYVPCHQLNMRNDSKAVWPCRLPEVLVVILPDDHPTWGSVVAGCHDGVEGSFSMLARHLVMTNPVGPCLDEIPLLFHFWREAVHNCDHCVIAVFFLMPCLVIGSVAAVAYPCGGQDGMKSAFAGIGWIGFVFSARIILILDPLTGENLVVMSVQISARSLLIDVSPDWYNGRMRFQWTPIGGQVGLSCCVRQRRIIGLV